MKTLSIAIFFFLLSSLSAQPPATSSKGGAPLMGATPLTGITRALVIGISNYQDAGIPSLKYAHADAKEFVTYLKSKGGGGLKDEQIKLLTNEQATTGQIYGALDWLIEACGPDDQALIYFSGHGDVETKTVRQQGFLLAYDTPKTNYMIGAVRLSDLNGYLESIVQERKSKIIVITDACRSGNLAGGRDGALATATALAAQFQNQVKIMSCQPNELSLEGEQWGGGRGVFSFHLLDGLTGLADNNKDSTVTLFELERYLLAKVPMETDQQQFPNTTGIKNTPIGRVDPSELAALIALRATPQQISPLAPKGFEDELLAKADTSVQQLYQAFLAAVDEHYFLPSDLKPGRGQGRSASELYDRLANEESLKPMRPLMKRNFAAALQDESQQTIKAYLRADQAELAKRWNNQINNYKTNPVYLSKAASLLGEGHVLHNQLRAKQHYFEGLIIRLEGGQKGDTMMLNEALALEFKALELDSGAAYVYNEIGLIYDEIRKVYKLLKNERMNSILFQKQIDSYGVAMRLAPKWVMPVNNIARTYKEWRKLKEAETMGLKAIELDSNFADPYDILNEVYFMSMQLDKIKSISKDLIRFRPDDGSLYYNIACIESLQNHIPESISWLEKAIQLGYTFDAIQNDSDLGNIRITEGYKSLMKRYFPDKKD
jgi:protein O-mannosyl-transferase